MKQLLVVCLVVVVSLNSLFGTARAHNLEAGRLVITHPWIDQAKSGGSSNIRMTISNEGYDYLHLIGFTTSSASKSRLTFASNGTTVSYIESIAIPPNDEVNFRRARLSIELIGLKRGLRDGDSFPGTLHFANGGQITIVVVVGRERFAL